MASTDVEQVLTHLGLQDYLQVFVSHGFADWNQFENLSCPKLSQLGVKRGHIRKIQRCIARARLWPDSKPLPTPSQLDKHEETQTRLLFANQGQQILEENYSYASPSPSLTSGETIYSNGDPNGPQTGFRGRLTELLATQSTSVRPSCVTTEYEKLLTSSLEDVLHYNPGLRRTRSRCTQRC